MNELEAVEFLQGILDVAMTSPHTEWASGSVGDVDPQRAWVSWSCWQVRVGLGYHMPELAAIRVLRVYRLFYYLAGHGGADFDVQVGYSGRSERVKVLVEGIGANTCRLRLYRWVSGQRRRIGPGVVGVQIQTAGGVYIVRNLQTMPQTRGESGAAVIGR